MRSNPSIHPFPHLVIHGDVHDQPQLLCGAEARAALRQRQGPKGSHGAATASAVGQAATVDCQRQGA